MSWEAWTVDDAGDPLELTGFLPLEGWELREQAEEGSTPTSSITFPDGDMELDLVGHRLFYVIETTSESDDDVLFGGFTWGQKVSRGRDESFEPAGRAWALEVNDLNAWWQRVVLKHAECNLGAQTDVERVEEALTFVEASFFDDTTTYFHISAPAAMDAVDYRGQYFGQLMQDAAEAGGKNWWAKLIRIGGDLTKVAWYGRDDRTTYDSPLALSNLPSDWVDDELLDGTSLVWPVSEDTEDDRDPSRVYCGIYATYEGGSTYRHSTATHDAFAHRDSVVPMPNVKSKTKAQARADRMLADIDTQDERITTRVRLPAAKATMIRAGMRVSVRLTHVPGLEEPKWCRVLACTVKPVAAGTQYDLTLEMTPTGPPDPGDEDGGDYTGGVFAMLQASDGDGADHRGPLFYAGNSDDAPISGYATQATTGPIVVDPPSAGVLVDMYNSVTVSAPMTVRIWVIADATGVYVPDTLATMTVRVNGDIIGTDAHTMHSGPEIFEVDVRDYHLEAGDVVSVEGSGDTAGSGDADDIFWTTFGVTTWFVVVRGTFMSGDFVGP